MATAAAPQPVPPPAADPPPIPATEPVSPPLDPPAAPPSPPPVRETTKLFRPGERPDWQDLMQAPAPASSDDAPIATEAAPAIAEDTPAGIAAAPASSVDGPPEAAPEQPATPLIAVEPPPAPPQFAVHQAPSARSEPPEPAESAEPPPVARGRGLLIGIAAVLLLGAGGGYAWWSGMIGDRPAQVALALQTQLAAAGLEDVRVTMAPGFVARLEGEVDGEEMRNRALALAQTHPGISAVDDGLTLRDVQGDRLDAANAALAARGLTGLQVESGPGEGLTLVGLADGAAQVNDATRALAARLPGVKVTVDVTRSPTWVLADVRAALGRAGLQGARARMIDETTVMLEGEVASDDLRATAEAAARVPGIERLENNLTVPEYAPLDPEIADAMGVEPVRTYRPAPPVLQPRGQVATADAVPAAFLGQWGGRGQLNGFVHVMYLSIRPGRIGSVVGEGAYASGSGRSGGTRPACRTALVLTQIDGDVITLEERLTTRGGFDCAGDKIIQLRSGSGAVSGQWLRKRDNSIAIRTVLYANLVRNGSRLEYLGTD